MSGGKGGSTTSSVQIPSWAQDAAKKNIAMGDYAAQLGYMPYYGLDVAAQTPAQQAASQNFGSAVSAFGGQAPVDMNAGMPTAQTIDGVTGYSSGGLFDSALAELQQRRPEQYKAYTDMFINPQTGERGTVFTPYGSAGTTSAADYQLSQSEINQLQGMGTQGEGNPNQAVDWFSLSPEMQRATNFLIPGYGVVNAVSSAFGNNMNDTSLVNGSLLTGGGSGTSGEGTGASYDWSSGNISQAQSDLDSSGYGYSYWD